MLATCKTCSTAVVLQDLDRNRTDIVSALLSPDRSEVAPQVVPDTASTINELTPLAENRLRYIDRDDVNSENECEPDAQHPAVQNEVVLGGVENDGIQELTGLVWSDIPIPDSNP